MEMLIKEKKRSIEKDFQPREELLLKRKEEFRYLVHKNYKVFYWLNKDEDRIEITDIFDTRQNPAKTDRSQ